VAIHEGGSSTVTDKGRAQIPASIREQLDIEPGDELRWCLDEEGELTVEVVHQRAGAFDDVDSISTGEPSDPRQLEDQHGGLG
jgi:AbrB family looped-hinge helix DNA binding protein